MSVSAKGRGAAVWLGLALLSGCHRAPASSSTVDGAGAKSVAPAAPRVGMSELRIPGEKGALQAYLWRPDGPGPFPAIVYNHGSEKEAYAALQGDVGPFFRSQGFVVLFPYRRGAGGSEGPYWRDEQQKLPLVDREAGTIKLLEEENADVVAGVEYLKAQPYVDAKHISVAGCSFGGIQTLLTAEKSLGLASAVDFAGGAMAWATNPLIRERLLRAAESATVPVFFVQAENDFNTAPSKILSEAMRTKNKPYRVHIFPPHGKDHKQGHGGFCMHGQGEWGPEVLAFLRGQP